MPPRGRRTYWVGCFIRLCPRCSASLCLRNLRAAWILSVSIQSNALELLQCSEQRASELVCLSSRHCLVESVPPAPTFLCWRIWIYAFLKAFPSFSASGNMLNTVFLAPQSSKCPKHYKLVSNLILEKRYILTVPGKIEKGIWKAYCKISCSHSPCCFSSAMPLCHSNHCEPSWVFLLSSFQ